MSGPNNPGKIADMNTNIKQFYNSTTTASPWIYKRNNTNTNYTMITTATPNDVLIPKNLFVNGTVYNQSDERIKNIIKELNETEDDICTLNPILFTYKSDIYKKPHYGLIAQEVEQQFPSLVETELLESIKNVNYIELIPLIITKIKSMNQEIQQLKSIINK